MAKTDKSVKSFLKNKIKENLKLNYNKMDFINKAINKNLIE